MDTLAAIEAGVSIHAPVKGATCRKERFDQL